MTGGASPGLNGPPGPPNSIIACRIALGSRPGGGAGNPSLGKLSMFPLVWPELAAVGVGFGGADDTAAAV